jgi:hypothetical protein
MKCTPQNSKKNMLCTCALLLLVVAFATSTPVAVPLLNVPLRGEGDDLRLDPMGLAALEHITAPVAVISVVGAHRTGKSLLLNHLIASIQRHTNATTEESKTIAHAVNSFREGHSVRTMTRNVDVVVVGALADGTVVVLMGKQTPHSRFSFTTVLSFALAAMRVMHTTSPVLSFVSLLMVCASRYPRTACPRSRPRV